MKFYRYGHDGTTGYFSSGEAYGWSTEVRDHTQFATGNGKLKGQI